MGGRYAVLLNFLCALSRPQLRLHKCDHQPAQVHLSAISEGRYYFSPLMIFYPCYDIIYLSFNLNATDVTDLINEFAHKMQNMNSWFWVGRGWGAGAGGCVAPLGPHESTRLDLLPLPKPKYIKGRRVGARAYLCGCKLNEQVGQGRRVEWWRRDVEKHCQTPRSPSTPFL